jgi:AcrR family transcriptional regulator
MKTQKTDLRSKYTQSIVARALLKLLSEKPLNKIAVAELCAVAKINRGTFYNHFYDVYDVYESIENEFNEEVKVKIQSIQSDNLSRVFFKEIMLLIYHNLDLVKVILINRAENRFLQNTLTDVKNKLVQEWMDKQQTRNQDYSEQIFSYITNGAIAIISDWVQNDTRQSIDEIAELIEKLNNLIIKEFIFNIK